MGAKALELISMSTHTLVVVLASLALAMAVPAEIESSYETSTDQTEARVAAEQQISLLQAQGMGDNACNDLAQSTIKEITDSVKADQKVLDSLSKGSNCKTEGDALVNAAKQAESLAKKRYDDAYNRAESAKVVFKSVAFGSLKSPSCSILDNSNYAAQLKSLNSAKSLRDRRSNEYQNAKSQHAKAKKAAAKAKADCACKALDTMDNAWAAASQSKSRAANDKAWRKAQQMSCVIKGVSMNSCKFPSTPTVKKPSLAPGVAAMCKREPLKCTVSTKASNSAGVVRPRAQAGTLVGGGINNHYRSWNSKAGFEQMYPDGNHYSCDMGFGPGRLTCYGIYCTTGGKALDCTTRSYRFHGSGGKSASLPAGYTMTGGGIVNHYRHWNAKAGFEGSEPHGNKWAGDMGFGSGDYTVYVRGCKGVKCVTIQGKRGNSAHANCPAGYTVTGCGIVNHYRHWNAKSGFEQTNPHGNGCLGDAGFGSGDQTTFARCCKMA